MVGVPGRSNACSRCRVRKKGCDAQQPACLPCRRAHVECHYGKPRIFVNSTKEKPLNGKGYSIEKSLPRPSSAAELRRVSSHRRATGPSKVVQLDALTKTAYITRYLELFWNKYYPQGVSCEGRGYTSALQILSAEDNTLKLALLASSFCTLAPHSTSELWMSLEGKRLYGEALRRLNSAIRKPEAVRRTSVLATVKCLSLYEVFFGWNENYFLTQSINWEGHIAGEVALLSLRTPAAHIMAEGHDIFASGRIHLLLSVVIARKRSVLSASEWKSVPWSKTVKNHKDLLIDMLFDMPGLLEDLDTWQDTELHEEKSRLHEKLISSCRTYDASLQAWANSVDPTCDILGSSYQPPETESISIEQLGYAHGLSLYWTACLLLYSTQQKVCGDGIESTLPARADPRTYIQKIARVIPVLLHPSTSMYGQHIAAFPLGIALQFALSDDSMVVEQRLLASNFERPTAKAVYGFLMSVNCNEPRLTHPLSRIDGWESIAIRAKCWSRWTRMSTSCRIGPKDRCREESTAS